MNAFPTLTRIIFLKLLFWVCLAFILKAEAAVAEPPEEIRISMELAQGFGDFTPFSGILRQLDDANPWKKSYPVPEGLPEHLSGKEVQLLYVTHDFVQHAWQSYITGTLDSAFVHNALNSWGVNPEQLTDQPLGLYTVLLSWVDEAGDAFVMYSDEAPYTFEDAEMFKVPAFSMQDTESQPLALPVNFEVYREGAVHRLQRNLRLNIPAGFNMPGIEGPVLFYGYYEHFKGELTIAGESFEAGLHNHFMSALFGEESDMLQVRSAGGEWSEPAKPGQFLKLGEHAYQFVSAAFDGSEVVLRYVPDYDEQRGTQAGMRALAFEQEDLSGELISLDEELGKWVFLDFWGTWCGPCIAEMPYLKEAWRLFLGDEFQFIGIANDTRETLERFVEEWELGWPQLISHGSETNALNELYGIRAWPTTMLLNDEGIITETSVRGFQLERRLSAEIGFDEIRAQRLLEGDVVVGIPEAVIADFVASAGAEAEELRVEVQGEGLPFRSRIPLYLHEGNWVRGLSADHDRMSGSGQTALELRIFVNGEPAELPLPGQFTNEEGEVRYRFELR
ncbi:MAG: TlpA family protein disulfide reductase [Candidatus Cyclonatronum sp.]|uniref:TlpA family protein disulfide reductase n=1 Tax=Cyclonatronum sp. TaxID=3024185 RepID=UPI0025B808B8|nr:TlpA disulfide reductase family protein [Cyclonatronum sp.]MCH8485396.1 TlpA family protein disulfide reductase [Cyclonatronum sp.]